MEKEQVISEGLLDKIKEKMKAKKIDNMEKELIAAKEQIMKIQDPQQKAFEMQKWIQLSTNLRKMKMDNATSGIDQKIQQQRKYFNY